MEIKHEVFRNHNPSRKERQRKPAAVQNQHSAWHDSAGRWADLGHERGHDSKAQTAQATHWHKCQHHHLLKQSHLRKSQRYKCA